MPQRARVLPSSFLPPFFTSSIEKTWKRRKRPSVPLNAISRGGTDRPTHTDGASSDVPYRPSGPAQRRGAPPSFPCDPGIVSEHIGFDPTPNVLLAGLRSIVVETTRFSNQPKTGHPTVGRRYVPATTKYCPGMPMSVTSLSFVENC